jgi:hypothetical protein
MGSGFAALSSAAIGKAPVAAGPDGLHGLSTTARSWTEIRRVIPNSGSVTMTLAPNFGCDYGSEIAIPAGTNVTIHGNGAVLDASQKGRFFTVPSGATLALDHLVLQHGYVSGDNNVSARLHGLASVMSSASSEHALVVFPK